MVGTLGYGTKEIGLGVDDDGFFSMCCSRIQPVSVYTMCLFTSADIVRMKSRITCTDPHRPEIRPCACVDGDPRVSPV